jgi:hypothetical protein
MRIRIMQTKVIIPTVNEDGTITVSPTLSIKIEDQGNGPEVLVIGDELQTMWVQMGWKNGPNEKPAPGIVAPWSNADRQYYMANEQNEIVPTDEGVELSDGGVIEHPDPDGTIRRRDKDGNCEEVRAIGDDWWEDWAELFGKTAEDFKEDDDE